MKMEMRSELVTNGCEKRMSGDTFSLEQDGYTLYPLDRAISGKREENGKPFGKVKIESLTLENEKTKIRYRLLTLHTVN
jgi:hypothetical protein